MIFRKINNNDFEKVIYLLNQLTNVGNIKRTDFDLFLNLLNDNHQIWVAEIDLQIVAIGTLLKEPKIIHGFSKVGHIEDIVVDNKYNGMGIGKKMIQHLIEQSNDCYKVILDCKEELEVFYNKCGLEKRGIQMAKYQ
jgi:glucosamine-phosphate N-acetyltransferase